MSKQFTKAVAEIADASYSKACEHALTMGGKGKTPREILEDIDMGDAFENPTWEDAVFALDYVHRRLPKPDDKPDLPKHAFSGPMATKRPKLTPRPTPAVHIPPSETPSIIDTAALAAKRMAGR